MIAGLAFQKDHPTENFNKLLRKNVKAAYSVKQSVFTDCLAKNALKISEF